MKTIVLSNGKKLTVQSVNPLLMRLVNTSLPPQPQPPTYEAPTAGGDVEHIPHDETTLQTDEEKQAYQKYKDSLKDWSTKRNDRFMRVLLSRGIKLDLDAAAMNRWAREMATLGVEVPAINEDDPDDPEPLIERHVLYIETELISHPKDLMLIMREVMALSGIDEAEVAAATNLFRGEMEKSADNG